MTLIETLEYASNNGIEILIHPYPKIFYLELHKGDRRFCVFKNSCDDEEFKERLHDVIEVFLNHEEKRKSEYSTPINQDLGILGE